MALGRIALVSVKGIIRETTKEISGIMSISLENAVQNGLIELKAYGGTMQGVPSGYTMTEWTRNANSTRVQTGIIADVDDMVIEVDCDAVLGSFYLIQNRTSEDKIFGITGTSSGAKIQLNFGTTNPFLTSTISREAGNRYLIRAGWKNGNASLYVKDFVNDVEDTQTGTYTWSAQTDELNVFYSKGGGASLSQGCEIRSLKIWKQDVLVLNYIPCKDSKGAYFYDTVSKKIVSATTGGLNAGNNILPTPTAPMDIVCNNGVIKVRRQSGLPLEYQMVSWLKSAGAIPITGFKTKNTQEITTAFYREIAANIYLYSSDASSSATTTTTAYLASPGNWRWGKNFLLLQVEIRSKITSVQSSDGVFFNGKKQGSYTNVNEFVSNNDLSLSSNANTSTRIYSMTIREGETVTLDLVPVQRLSDSTYGFYDKVGDKFYTNAEATFVAGGVIDDPIEIYTDGTTETITDSSGLTATAEMLLKVGDYADEQEILSGNITRKVGIKVLDGTETWYSIGASVGCGIQLGDNSTSNDNWMLCSHFIYAGVNKGISILAQNTFSSNTAGYTYFVASNTTDVNTFKQWLADQYNAGTPVIIVYPLETPTTESVTGQAMDIPDGNSTIDIIQASLNTLELSAIYKALHS